MATNPEYKVYIATRDNGKRFGLENEFIINDGEHVDSTPIRIYDTKNEQIAQLVMQCYFKDIGKQVIVGDKPLVLKDPSTTIPGVQLTSSKTFEFFFPNDNIARKTPSPIEMLENIWYMIGDQRYTIDPMDKFIISKFHGSCLIKRFPYEQNLEESYNSPQPLIRVHP